MLLGVGCGLCVHAQRDVVATGGDAQGSAGSVTWSVGQAAYTAPESSAGRVSQGVQQVYDVTPVSTSEPMDPAMTATVGPNPTNDGVMLRLSGTPPPHAGFQLLDPGGRIVRTGPVTATETFIHLAHLAAGSYVLSLIEHDRPVLVVRIIKH